MFINREEAGKLLGRMVAQRLADKRADQEHRTVVIGLPRGGVPVAKEVADILKAPLTILVSKKIGAPSQPELAIGAVSSRGVVVLNDDLGPVLNQLSSYVRSQASQLSETTKAKELNWLRLAGLKPERLAGKNVIVVDDGIATGMTALAALRSIAAERPARLILAVPVIARETYYKFQNECTAVIAVTAPTDLNTIGQFYGDFHQVEDDEMLQSLMEANENLREIDNDTATAV